MWETVTILCLVVLCIIGVLATALRLPGTWLIVLTAAGYGYWTDWSGVGIKILIGLAIAAVLAEVVEFLMSVFTARKAGASRQAAWGGLLGGLLGMFFLSFLVPIPLVGTMVGAVLGCFCGAMLVELAVRKRINQGARVGLASALGSALGTATKMAVALLMSAVLLTSAVCNQTPGVPTPLAGV